MAQPNESNLETRVNRLEDGQIDLQLAVSALIEACDKNTADITALIQVAGTLVKTDQQHAEDMAAHAETMAAHEKTMAAHAETMAAHAETMAAHAAHMAYLDQQIARLDRQIVQLDRVIEYLIERDEPQED